MAKSLIVRPLDKRHHSIRWDEDSPISMQFEKGEETVRSRHGRFVGGRADGVEIVRLETSSIAVEVLPTRGMGIHRIESGGVRFGWRSPVKGPVHPSLVPISEPSGLGWLSGFDELLVRCGLESNGAPEHDDNGQLKFPLHGRIANTPADALEIETNEASGRLDLIGHVDEARLFFTNFRLRSRVRVHAGSGVVEVLDEVTNEGSTSATMQMLYHINIGLPVLDEGSELKLPIAELAPKDRLSASEIDAWNRFAAPQPGYQERVYFASLQADESGMTRALLKNSKSDTGLSVAFGTKTLPRFVIWKSTAGREDGYVTGLEPATNFPNTRGYEESQGRVVSLEPEETVSFRVKLEPHTDAESVAGAEKLVDDLIDEAKAVIHRDPKPGWTPGT